VIEKNRGRGRSDRVTRRGPPGKRDLKTNAWEKSTEWKKAEPQLCKRFTADCLVPDKERKEPRVKKGGVGQTSVMSRVPQKWGEPCYGGLGARKAGKKSSKREKGVLRSGSTAAKCSMRGVREGRPHRKKKSASTQEAFQRETVAAHPATHGKKC